MNKQKCYGCYNDIYNHSGQNHGGVGECWHLKTAKIVWRIRVGNFEEPICYMGRKSIRIPNCYRTGSCGDKFLVPPKKGSSKV